MLSHLLHVLQSFALSAILVTASVDFSFSSHAANRTENGSAIREVRLRQILILKPSGATDVEQATGFQRATELRKRVINGEDFATLARNYSQDVSGAVGGDLGWVRRLMLVQPIDDAAFSLTPGEVSSVIRTDFGFHIIKVEAERIR